MTFWGEIKECNFLIDALVDNLKEPNMDKFENKRWKTLENFNFIISLIGSINSIIFIYIEDL